MKRIISVTILTIFLCTMTFSASERVRYIEGVYNLESESVPITEVGRTRDNAEAMFLDSMVKKSIEYALPSDYDKNMDSYIESEDDEEFREYLVDIKEAARNERQQRGDPIPWFLRNLAKWQIIRGNPRLFRIYHKVIMFFYRSNPEQVEKTPAFIKTDFVTSESFEFVRGNSYKHDEVPHSKFSELFRRGKRVYGTLSMPIPFPEKTHVNSKRLADALNQLSNFRTTSRNYKPLYYNNGKERFLVNTQEDLINKIIDDPDYEVYIYEARAGNDYVGLYLKENGKYKSIEIPTYVKTYVGRKKVYFPATHGEYLLVVYRKGEVVPTSVNKWYIGIPTDPALKQATLWKPVDYRKASWQGYKITCDYKDRQTINRILKYSRNLQKFINYIQLEHEYPMNGYGIFGVCNDSISLIRGFLGEDPAMGLFPNLRAIAIDKQYFRLMRDEMVGEVRNSEGYLTIPSDPYFSSNYKNVIRQTSAQRLSFNFPYRNRSSINGLTYKLVYDEMKEKIPGFTRMISQQVDSQVIPGEFEDPDDVYSEPDFQPYDPDHAFVNVKSANIRRGPGTSHGVVAVLMRHTKVKVLSEHGNWVKIRVVNGASEGIEAFIYSGLLADN